MAHRWDPKAPHPGRLVLPVRIDRDGGPGPTAAAVRGAGWRRTSYGFHVPAETPDDRPEQWTAEASVRLPPGGRITGWAACRLHEANFFDGLGRDGRTRPPIPVTVGPRGRIRHRTGLQVHHGRVPMQHHATRYGLPTVSAAWAKAEAARLAPSLIDAVIVVDMMCVAAVVSIQLLRESGLRFRPGVLDEASEHSRSPHETRCRLRCRFALPRCVGWSTARSTTCRGGCSASPTWSISRPVSSWSSTAPTTGRPLGTLVTWSRRTHCAGWGWRWSG